MAERITIDHVGHRGDGVSIDRPPTYVPFTLPGEIVEAENHDGKCRLARIDQPSSERIDPFCSYFTRCGGCAIQHWQPTPYQAWKRQIVVDTLSQSDIDCPVDPVVDAHGAGRRRVTLHARYKMAKRRSVSPRPPATPSLRSTPARSSTLHCPAH